MKQLKFENISFKYRKKDIINDLNLTLDGKKCTALVGPNGSGKTTIGKLLMGILKPEGGCIYYDDLDISNNNLSYLGGRIGYLFQNPAKQIFAVTVRDDLGFPLRMNGEKEEIIHKKIDSMTDLFHLEKIIDSKCHLLSQGEKQRVALASIFMREPEYLILDEPTTSLDQVRKEMLGQSLKKVKEKGVGILLISHDKKFVESYADEIIEMGDL
ncbi:ABC transporter ATP-binding protein [Acidaminobacter sp. JC074]|uniref:energy-coupling factor ABC transporter ATP-binding protein n=1 Tax=Acidaminobacter sp. JC074 TaxID=2530199 RepID=UPI001F103E75|nr:ABC transporter ATP-binding protein [Acidaminobacter sp. JC074]MCH4888098.1 ABC transporter ATP-binding protein [Acidaminobacter sp. JC074]